MYNILRLYMYIFALPVYIVRLGYVCTYIYIYEYYMTRACACMHVHIAVISLIMHRILLNFILFYYNIKVFVHVKLLHCCRVERKELVNCAERL